MTRVSWRWASTHAPIAASANGSSAKTKVRLPSPMLAVRTSVIASSPAGAACGDGHVARTASPGRPAGCPAGSAPAGCCWSGRAAIVEHQHSVARDQQERRGRIVVEAHPAGALHPDGALADAPIRRNLQEMRFQGADRVQIGLYLGNRRGVGLLRPGRSGGERGESGDQGGGDTRPPAPQAARGVCPGAGALGRQDRRPVARPLRHRPPARPVDPGARRRLRGRAADDRRRGLCRLDRGRAEAPTARRGPSRPAREVA